MTATQPDFAKDMLRGAEEIAEFLLMGAAPRVGRLDPPLPLP